MNTIGIIQNYALVFNTGMLFYKHSPYIIIFASAWCRYPKTFDFVLMSPST